VCDKLLEFGIVAAPLHGESSKDDRKEILSRLRDGRLQLVVSTELAARGIDIPNLTHVINFELPTDSQHYVHRQFQHSLSHL
jgi:ATP-dependent RNA helicase DeaD